MQLTVGFVPGTFVLAGVIMDNISLPDEVIRPNWADGLVGFNVGS